jgi:arabinofuranan 3-O-arabinosyltransferase
VRLRSKTELAALAALAYGPFLASSPGRVSADSKQDLYLDPARFLSRAVDLWDPHVGAGTVPHQNLGYLFPTGPWFWILDRIGVPDWVAQRLWLGTLSLLAVLGARWLFRQLGTGTLGAVAGALVYMLTPYQLAFTARISVLLLPWAALPWLVGLTMRATRTKGWRDPALVALVLALAGGVNASSLALVLLAPALWVVLEVARRPSLAARVLAAVARVTALSLGICLWWLVGLRLQGAHGLPVLQLTENVRTVAEVSTPGDVLRGLGNWFFYGRDRTGYSVDQAADYARNDLVVALSYAVPVAGLLAALLLRWVHRAYFALLVVVGTVVAVGAWPYDDTRPFGSLWKAFTSDTSLGLALRNSPRVVPIVVLGWAGLLAAAVGAVPAGLWRRAASATVAVLALAALLPVWQTGYLTDGMQRPEAVPDYWQEAIAAIDGGDHGTRVLELPGSSFAAYRWGTTVDPITPGLTDRPYLAREVLPAGTPASVNLLDALDRRLQQGTFEPASLAPIARLLGVGTVAFRADLDQSGRFDTPPTAQAWQAFQPAPAGLDQAVTFGPPGGDGGDPSMPSVALFDVVDPRPIVRTAAVEGPVVVAGDGDGLVDAAAAGLIDGRSLVLEATALDDDALTAALDAGAHLVLTDSNRRRIQTWFYSLRDTRGPTERAGETAPDPTGYDFRLDPFPGSSDDSRTVVEQVGGQVDATAGGGPERPEDRGAHAVDGDVTTSWRVGGADPRGNSLTITPDEPISTGELRLVQPTVPPGGRALARVAVTVDDDAPITVDLGPDSRRADGQTVTFPARPVRRVRIELLETSPPAPTAPGATPVGLAEVRLGSLVVGERVRLPVDLLRRVGREATGHSLDVVLTRLRLDVTDPDRRDDEARIDRRVDLPVSRTFQLSGVARPAGDLDEPATVDGAGCRDDLLLVDGAPVAVRLVSTGPLLEVIGCAPLALSGRSHRIEATAASATGIAVDRLVLSSGADGQPAAVAVRGSAVDGPTLRVTDADASQVRVDVDTDGRPFWLVLGQSASDGWSASAAGASLGDRQLVDGYANGWLVTPDEAGRITISLRWGPQRLVWVGLAASALVLLVAVALLWRARGRHDPVEPVLSAVPEPVWRGAWEAPVRWQVVAVAVAVVATGSVLVAPLSVALLAAGLTLVAGLVPRGRLLLVVAAPAALIVSRVDLRPSLAWLAVALLAADLLLSRTDRATRPG